MFSTAYPGHNHVHAHTLLQFRDANQPASHVNELWEETIVPEGKRYMAVGICAQLHEHWWDQALMLGEEV